jgi:hypothetical protein
MPEPPKEKKPSEIIDLYAKESNLGQYFYSLKFNMGISPTVSSPSPSGPSGPSSSTYNPNRLPLFKGSTPLTLAENRSFFIEILKGIGIPNPNPSQIGFMQIWRQHEGGKAAFNPFNTILPLGNYTLFSVSKLDGKPLVKNYPDIATGLLATIDTLKQSNFSSIVASIKQIKDISSMNATMVVINNSPWGSKFNPPDASKYKTFNNLILGGPQVPN